MKVKLLSHVRLLATPRTVAYQASLSMGFSRQEHWSGLPFPSPGDLPNPGIEHGSPTLQADALPSEPPVIGKFLFTEPTPCSTSTCNVGDCRFPRVCCCQLLDFCDLMDRNFCVCAFSLHFMVACVCKDGYKSSFYSMCFFFSPMYC